MRLTVLLEPPILREAEVGAAAVATVVAGVLLAFVEQLGKPKSVIVPKARINKLRFIAYNFWEIIMIGVLNFKSNLRAIIILTFP